RTVANHLNPLMEPLVSRVPTAAVLRHRGRRTGRSYNTPGAGLPHISGIRSAAGLQSKCAWALNLLAARGGEMTRCGRRYQLTQPRRAGSEPRQLLPARVELMMRAARINDSLQFDATRL